MKAYTDIEQSKKLEKILPLETADMFYVYDRHLGKLYGDTPYPIGYKVLNENVDIPCWSLVALLNVINTNYYTALYHDGVAWNIDIIHHDNDKEKHSAYANTPIDACVEMFIELNEQKLL